MNGRVRIFQKRIRSWYRRYGRHKLPWRKNINPYRVLVSEFMLQQTQVSRVIPKYHSFLRAFPTIQALAEAPLGSVLRHWQGLGYNRRALFLKRTAEVIARKYGGRIPDDPTRLERLPGIGPGTAGAITAFAYNRSTYFLETNIRRVYLHHFFSGRSGVSDREILDRIQKTLPRRNAREWYWALMDCGALLAKGKVNPNRRSARYTLQKPFAGSKREFRGKVLAAVVSRRALNRSELTRELAIDPKARYSLGRWSLGVIVSELVRDGFLRVRGEEISIATR